MAARQTAKTAPRRARRKARRSQAQRTYETLSIEGGLLAPEWLEKVASLDAPGQAESDYRIPKGLSLRDEIGRYWRVAQAHFGDFSLGCATGAEPCALAERFVLALLREAFCFGTLGPVAPVVLAERAYPIGHAALSGRVPVVIAPAGLGVETASPLFLDGARKRSAFGLVQEYLNADEGALWGVASDGATLRIVRDNASLTRPAWIQADLLRMFREERYADFAALWLLLHETRFGKPDQPVTECPLEAWRNAGREQGTRAREHLRRGVEDALLALGGGFLAHKDNGSLREALSSGALKERDYFNQLLRLVYRLIFLLTVEERGLLHPDGTSEAARELYETGYSLRRLRERAARRSAYDRHEDLWAATRIVFRGVAEGEPRLGLPALAGLFAKSQCAALDAAKLENRALLLAMYRLSWLQDEGGLSRVNWRDMGPEELGSVYESLLELVPLISVQERSFRFATGGETKGNARKTTGSYYTPESLVNVLLDSALEPVIKERLAANPDRPVEALLSLSIVDPACGSGHFLLAAARRLAGHVARLTSSGTPTTKEYQHALRQVVGRCIYGVDLNPMAVELCKVALWMEAVEPGLPLGFLDAHIRQGNALLGTTPELMKNGIPDEAWAPIEGDNRQVATSLKGRNRQEATGQTTLGLWAGTANEANEVTRAVAELEDAPDGDAFALSAKESRWAEIQGSGPFRHQRFVADAWCAAFVWPKPDVQPSVVEAAPTMGLWRDIRDGKEPPALTVSTVEMLASQYHFFHWHLAFPTVFERGGGFDVVLGNPPWDALLFQEEEFFAGTRPEIAGAPTAAARKRMIARLVVEDPPLYQRFRDAQRLMAGANSFIRAGVRFPLCGLGRVNLFALFAELARSTASRRGRVGQILPSGIVSDDSTKLFFQAIVDRGEIVSFIDFENREAIFPAVHRSFKFGILTLSGAARAAATASFRFFVTRVEHLAEPGRQFSLSAADIGLLNPFTKTCPIFRASRDAEITKSIYRRHPVLRASQWKVEIRRLLNSADDSNLFKNAGGANLLPLIEGKYFHQFDHRWVTHDHNVDRQLSNSEYADPYYAIRPRYWYPAADVMDRFGEKWQSLWVLAYRKIVRSTDERTFISAVVPSLAVSDSAKALFVDKQQVPLAPCLIANFSSIAFDYVSRQKIGGSNMSAFIAEQLPVLQPDAYNAHLAWQPGSSIRDWLLTRVLELTYTAWDLEPYAKDVGYDGPPFRWDPDRRFLLRAELDAAFFHLYGLSRGDTDYIMDTFPIVKKNDEKAHGEYRTKRVILEIYDAMAEAARTGVPYQTRLDPPPADPRVAHPPRSEAILSPKATG